MRTLQVAEAAELIGVSADTLRRLADRGIVPVQRLPSGHRRFEAVDILAFSKSLQQARKIPKPSLRDTADS